MPNKTLQVRIEEKIDSLYPFISKSFWNLLNQMNKNSYDTEAVLCDLQSGAVNEQQALPFVMRLVSR